MTVDPSSLSTQQVQAFLQSAVAPRPIALASTINAAGEVNLSPFSFFNLFSANPPIVIFSPARRVTNGTTKHTLENVQEIPEVVINIVNYAMVEQMSLSSTEYEKGVNEFIKSGLTPLPSEKIRPPRVAESPVALECSVEQVIPLGDGPGAGNLVVAKVQLLHIQDTYLNPAGQLDTEKLDLVARMGANWYCRASGDALFEIPKPLTTKGIGVDQLPAPVRRSAVLTGNQLGRLGNLEKLPSPEALERAAELPDVAAALRLEGDAQISALHQLAAKYLESGKAETALAIVFQSRY
ncbi:MAG: flavin reductase family protein [Chitinophagales bacterium]|jgi:flavin reductase (DIM6/NTAB) family NADH-FMN oxidoreductase RutF